MDRSVLALGILALIAWYYSRSSSRSSSRAYEGFNTATVQTKTTLKKDTSDWTKKLSAAVDTVSEHPTAARQPVPHDETEIRDLATKIVARINSATGARAVLLDVPQVQKTVDSYKIIDYELVLVVHSAQANAALKLFARAQVPKDNVIYIAELRMYTANNDDGGPRGSVGPEYEEAYAAFEPVMQYTD